MFPPTTPVTERMRIEFEKQELERRLAHQVYSDPDTGRRLSLRLPRLPFAALVASVRAMLTPARTQPPARDCQ